MCRDLQRDQQKQHCHQQMLWISQKTITAHFSLRHFHNMDTHPFAPPDDRIAPKMSLVTVFVSGVEVVLYYNIRIIIVMSVDRLSLIPTGCTELVTERNRSHPSSQSVSCFSWLPSQVTPKSHTRVIIGMVTRKRPYFDVLTWPVL